MFWTDLSYLNAGSDRQRDAYQALIELDIFSVLASYDPQLTGTLPLGIETPESDIDIICEAQDLDDFDTIVAATYSYLDEFEQRRSEKEGIPTTISNFRYHRFPVELFAQPVPTEEQRSYRHLIAESRLLREGGEEATEAIRELKLEGMKTEPAFGEYFCLEGDPYLTLLELADAPTSDLVEVVINARMARRDKPVRVRPMERW